MRNPGITLHKLPLFVWAIFVTAILLLLSLPVLAGKFVPALNVAVCWELFNFLLSKKIADNQQVTLDKPISTGNLNDCAPQQSIFPIESYLAGLIEGDGTIYVPIHKRSPKGKKYYPSIQIEFQQKDFPLCIVIQKQLGFGSIAKVRHSASYRLTVNDSKGIEKLIILLNGKFRGPKYHQYCKLRTYLSIQETTLPKDESPLNYNNWLTGFIEADGSFQIRTSVTSKQKRIALGLEISQARITRYGYSTHDMISIISNFLQVRTTETRSDSKYPQYRVRTYSVETNKIISDYLTRYPLQGSKQLDFQDWNRVLDIFKNNKHIINISEITAIKDKINQKREEFTWDHILIGK